MRAMILAAGLGSRMQPLTRDLPKPLLDVNGISLIEYTINHLRNYGIKEFIINVSYLGEKIKLALKSIEGASNIIFLDEPYSNLDSRLKEKIRDQMLHILREYKISALLVTHDPEEAMFMSDKIGVLNNGFIEQFGSPIDLYLRPKSAFIAEFFGEINILEGIVKEGSVSTVLGTFNCSQRFNNKKVKIVIRDEAIKLFSANKININSKDKTNFIKSSYYGYVMEARLLAGSSLVHLSLKVDKLNFHIHARIP